MNHETPYRPSTHPLGRIHGCGLTRSFQRAVSRVRCPVCAVFLDVYTHTATGGKAFLCCRYCAWFHAFPALDKLLDAAERAPRVPRNTNAIGGVLDRIAARLAPPGQAPPVGYARLSGGKRRRKR